MPKKRPRLKQLRPRIAAVADLSIGWPLTAPRNRKKPTGDFNYNSQRWRRLSRDFRMRNPLCAPCRAAGKFTLAEHVDHIVEIADGGDPWSEDNLQSLCRNCHSKKTAKSMAQRN